jgi:hypothetical protein
MLMASHRVAFPQFGGPRERHDQHPAAAETRVVRKR